MGSVPVPQGLKGGIQKSTFTFTLFVSRKTALGYLDLVAHGNGEGHVAGTDFSVEIVAKAGAGDIDLTGTASHVVANGVIHITGAIVMSGGPTSEINFKQPIDTVQLVISTAAPTRVTGKVPHGSWSAVRVGARKPCLP